MIHNHFMPGYSSRIILNQTKRLSCNHFEIAVIIFSIVKYMVDLRFLCFYL